MSEKLLALVLTPRHSNKLTSTFTDTEQDTSSEEGTIRVHKHLESSDKPKSKDLESEPLLGTNALNNHLGRHSAGCVSS